MLSLNKLWQNDVKFRNVLIVVALLVIFLAYMDISGLAMFNAINEGQGYTGELYKKAEQGYMNLFWTFAYMIGFIAALVYYIIRKDVSESLAIFGAYFFLIWGGLEDLFYFVLQGLSVPARLPWLDAHPFMGTVGIVIGEGVTNISLYISIIISLIIVYFLVKYLKRRGE